MHLSLGRDQGQIFIVHFSYSPFFPLKQYFFGRDPFLF